MAKEVGNPRYILDLLLSVIRASVETGEMVKGLPGAYNKILIFKGKTLTATHSFPFLQLCAPLLFLW